MPRLENICTIVTAAARRSVDQWLGRPLFELGQSGITFQVFVSSREVEPQGEYRGQGGQGRIQVFVGAGQTEDDTVALALHEFGHVIFEHSAETALPGYMRDEPSAFIFTSFNEHFADLYSAYALQDLACHRHAAGELRDFTMEVSVEDIPWPDEHIYLAPAHASVLRLYEREKELGSLDSVLDLSYSSLEEIRQAGHTQFYTFDQQTRQYVFSEEDRQVHRDIIEDFVAGLDELAQ
jgi:hypothetical protein